MMFAGTDYAERVFDWAGHIARMKDYDKHRIVTLELRRKDRDLLQHLERTQGSQCHGWRFHVWRWERRIYDYWEREDVKWKEIARNKEEWTARRKDFGMWAVEHYRG